MSSIETVDRTPVEAPPTRRRGLDGAVLLGIIISVSGLLWMLDLLDVIEVRFGLVLPVILTIIGLAIVIGSFSGPTPGLIVAAIFVALATLAVALAPPDAFHGGIGDRRYTVTDQADLQTRYDIGLGELRLDFSNLELTESATVGASVGAGNLVVMVPSGIPVHIDAAAGAGNIRFFGEDMGSGISVSRTYTSQGFDTAPVTLTLDLNVAAGEIRVVEQ